MSSETSFLLPWAQPAALVCRGFAGTDGVISALEKQIGMMGMNSLAGWRQGSRNLQANWFKYRLFRFWEQQQGAPKLHAAAAV